MKSDATYTPIACSFYDRIEEAIVLRKTVSLQFMGEDGKEQQLETRLKDTQTRSDGEFVVLPEGGAIRMDKIISLDGEPLLGKC